MILCLLCIWVLPGDEISYKPFPLNIYHQCLQLYGMQLCHLPLSPLTNWVTEWGVIYSRLAFPSALVFQDYFPGWIPADTLIASERRTHSCNICTSCQSVLCNYPGSVDFTRCSHEMHKHVSMVISVHTAFRPFRWSALTPGIFTLSTRILPCMPMLLFTCHMQRLLICMSNKCASGM